MKIMFAIAIFIVLAACDDGTTHYTLYWNSGFSVALEMPVRIHVAIFDAAESDTAFNRGNCAMTRRTI